MKFFDTHAHYYDERFAEEASVPVDTLINTLMAGDVPYIINVGTSPSTSRMAIAQAAAHPGMYTAVGIHPTDCQTIADPDAALAEIEELICDKSSKCVCLGEIGLDYHYDDTDKKKQLYFFREQLSLADRLNIPVCIHDRDAHGDVMATVREFPGVRGVLHSYSGSAEDAVTYIRLGYKISFSGTITFTNARKPRECAAVLPHDAVLIETDCPYLAPHPHRGTLNHSGNLIYTNAALAAAWGCTPEESAAVTLDNARRFFGI